MHNVRNVIIASAFGAGVMFTAPAFAGEDFRFSVQRAELETNFGVQRTVARIERFAAAQCRVNQVRALSEIDAAQDCAADIAAQILRGIDHPRLASAYRLRDRVAQR